MSLLPVISKPTVVSHLNWCMCALSASVCVIILFQELKHHTSTKSSRLFPFFSSALPVLFFYTLQEHLYHSQQNWDIHATQSVFGCSLFGGGVCVCVALHLFGVDPVRTVCVCVCCPSLVLLNIISPPYRPRVQTRCDQKFLQIVIRLAVYLFFYSSSHHQHKTKTTS